MLVRQASQSVTGPSIAAARLRDMQLSRRSRREWRIFFWFSLAAAVMSAWFSISIRSPDSSIATAIFVGVLTSLIIATPIALIELKRYRIPILRRLRRLPLPAYFAFKVAFYVVVILGGLMLS